MSQDLDQKLRWIGKAVPKSLRDKLTYRENRLKDQKDKAMRAVSTGKIRDRKIPKQNLREIESLLQRGAFDDNVEKIDYKVEAKINEQMNQIMREKIRSGELPDPKVVIREDRFYQERMGIKRKPY